MKNIQWKDIDEYNGLYQVSNTGLIRKKISDNKYTFMSICKKQGTNHLFVGLSKDRIRKMYYIHTLVGIAFLQRKDGENRIIHNDNDINNCFANNLVWCKKENIFKTNRIERFKSKQGVKNKKLSKKKIYQVKELIKNHKFQITRKLSIQYDVSFDTINNLM